jgi:hypothetical protein
MGMVVAGWVRVWRLCHMRVRMRVNDAMARVTNGVAVDMGMSYKRRWLEASLYRG